ncbi:MAG: hypothetical protein F4Z14_06665 [Gammaproteobacteria bacterium]|nr:hypothetical protein [Gammaproteobacteria bacterium]
MTESEADLLRLVKFIVDCVLEMCQLPDIPEEQFLWLLGAVDCDMTRPIVEKGSAHLDLLLEESPFQNVICAYRSLCF